MEDDEQAARARPRKLNHSRAVASVRAIILCTIGSLVTMALLLWSIESGFKLAADSRRFFTGYIDWGFHLGVLTMLFGFFFLLLGLPMLADLFLNLSEQLQEAGAIHKATKADKICQILKICISLVTMAMLWWAIYTGFRMATEPTRDSKYSLLTISIGVVTVIFGFTYFTIGLAIIAELGLDMLNTGSRRKTGKLAFIKVKAMM